MRDICDIYTSAVYGNLRPLYGNWLPDKPVELGDYGILHDRAFMQIGNVRQLGITFQPRKDSAGDQIIFSSKGSARVTLKPAGSGPVAGGANVKASLQIDFSSEDSVFFNAAGCAYNMIQDKAGLGKDIMKRFENRTWDRQWAVVTDIVQAGATTIAASGGHSSSIVFEADGNVPQINLADASVSLSVASCSNVALQIAARKGLSPLIGLSRIQHVFLFFGSQFTPAFSCFGNSGLSSRIEDAGNPATPEHAEDKPSNFYFGQMK